MTWKGRASPPAPMGAVSVFMHCFCLKSHKSIFCVSSFLCCLIKTKEVSVTLMKARGSELHYICFCQFEDL